MTVNSGYSNWLKKRAFLRHLTRSKKWILLLTSLIGIFSFNFSTNACFALRSELKMCLTVELNELSVCDSLMYPCSCSVCVFSKWHCLHKTWRLERLFDPPSASGMMWSMSNFFFSSLLNSWQHPSALSNMRWRSSLVGWWRAILVSRNRF